MKQQKKKDSKILSSLRNLLGSEQPCRKNTGKSSQQAAFAAAAQASGKIFASLEQMRRHVTTDKLYPRLVQLLMRARKFDTWSAKGSKKVSMGVATSEGLSLFKGFDCNHLVSITKTCSSSYQLDKTTGALKIAAFEPIKHLRLPPQATHVCLQSAQLLINLSEMDGIRMGHSPAIYLPITAPAKDLELIPATFPDGKGTQLTFLQILFLQNVARGGTLVENGLYSVHNAYNVLSIVDAS